MKVRVVIRTPTLTLALSRFAGEGERHSTSWKVFGLVCLVLWFVTSMQSFAADARSLTVISYPNRPAKLPLWLAQDAGLFQKHGLKVTIKDMASSDELMELIRRGEGQIYAATANWMVSGIGDGKDLVFFANTGYSVLKLLAHPSITRPEQLKGKRVGTGEANSSQDRITRETLRRLGLDPERDVTLVPFGSRSVQRVNALLKGEIDATTSNEDNIFELERRGEINKVRILADNESLKLFIGAGVDFAVSGELLRKDREAVKSFIKALSEAIALARANRSWADRIYTKYLAAKDGAQLEFMYRTYVQGAIPERPAPRAENVALGIEEFSAKPGLKNKRAQDLVELGLFRELETEGFFTGLYRRPPEHGKYGE
jgi:NitT/TauT family transport system substrate-binding protein